MSVSSYSSVAPKPLQRLQAPRGLLKEKSCGVGDGARVPSLGHSKRSVNLRTGVWAYGRVGVWAGTDTGSVKAIVQSPSPSRNAVPTASGSRLLASSLTA